MSEKFIVNGKNTAALFTLKVYRGEGMALLAMNWKKGKPPIDFVGFAIEYMEPGGDRFFALKNRVSFLGADGKVSNKQLPTTLAPIQKFRWVHFPRNAEMPGDFTYKVTPAFMNSSDELSFGEAQTAALELRRETHPKKLNVTFTRGFVSSQAFVDRYESVAPISTLLPDDADQGLIFVPTHPKTTEALAWMGFEARHAILEVLDQAIADPEAQVRVVAYDLSEPEVVSRLEKLGSRLKIIIDDDGAHGEPHSGEKQSEDRLKLTAGNANVKRQHMGKLQHNKTIVVDSPKLKVAVCGSTNFTWRGFYVQANNAVIVKGKNAIKPFLTAFENYWNHDSPTGFGATDSAQWTSLGLTGIDAKITFSPHIASNAVLKSVADDIRDKTKASLFYSLAFLYQTPGLMLEAIKKVTENDNIFVYGISDKKVGGLDLQKPNGNVAPVAPSALTDKTTPEPFKSEPAGGSGNRMHHKFLVVDFNKPSARVYLGSYNFSIPADGDNGENLLLIRDRRVAVSYAIEALRLFDHYHFRLAQKEAKKAKKQLVLSKPPKDGELPWWDEYYSNPLKVKDRELFA
ncbi:MAG TPA: phospholipase D-like domain-containing protein [Anaerolineales bacterium]|nr:phospholipase D-like domain-containing protein [Anaerolineales bacterium]